MAKKIRRWVVTLIPPIVFLTACLALAQRELDAPARGLVARAGGEAAR
jgi:hypothetical protein